MRKLLKLAFSGVAALMVLAVVAGSSLVALAWYNDVQYKNDIAKPFPDPALVQLVSPTPSSVPKTATKTASKPQAEPTAECKLMDGKIVVISLSLCQQLTAKETEIRELERTQSQYETTQPAYTYVPPMMDYDSSFTVNQPPTMPSYTVPKSNYTFETNPAPTFGSSYNPNEVCETRSTNAGSITICR